ncbi:MULTISPECIES: hypothetical protein [Hyphomicrobiales]|uniref:hypothetical protein n=1 Tax=Hyphomicrobiales TaxID=356 RepID=UPI001BCFA4E1|nr:MULTISPECIES: hypothetical protein [Hyphomicrobiales]CAH1662825.1 hypothetical protein CHELA41_22275 [Hyphomicrobiales bacterium]MBS7741486.1 hypothetical protein [Chelatococcus sp. HY11]MBX3491203.1 hypothetical protein [Parvibaculum sp.]MBX3544495.1 hypothetical protein [Chelatococcus sp.]MCO5078982.1 hypothetical protein [Chelatococcus sp.]
MLPLHERSFRRPEVAAILGVTEPVVGHLVRIALDPGEGQGRYRRYSFRELVQLAVTRALSRSEISPAGAGKAVIETIAAIISIHHLEQGQALRLYDLSRPLWVALAMGRDGDAEVIHIDASRSLDAFDELPTVSVLLDVARLGRWLAERIALMDERRAA